MLGWLLVVRSSPPGENVQLAETDETVLATWETGLGGTEWLNELVAAGKAKQIAFSGYPCRFVALASDVLPLLDEAPPRYTQLPATKGAEAGWTGNVRIYQDRVKVCPRSEPLTIDAWGQS